MGALAKAGSKKVRHAVQREPFWWLISLLAGEKQGKNREAAEIMLKQAD